MPAAVTSVDSCTAADQHARARACWSYHCTAHGPIDQRGRYLPSPRILSTPQYPQTAGWQSAAVHCMREQPCWAIRGILECPSPRRFRRRGRHLRMSRLLYPVERAKGASGPSSGAEECYCGGSLRDVSHRSDVAGPAPVLTARTKQHLMRSKLRAGALLLRAFLGGLLSLHRLRTRPAPPHLRRRPLPLAAGWNRAPRP